MLKMITFAFGLCALAIACAGPQHQTPTAAVPPGPVADLGPLTVQALDGVRIAATVHSVGRPTLVLVHGWMCDQSYWEAQVPALAAKFAVVTIDLAGHGQSGVDRQNWTIASLGGDVAAVIKHLDLKDVIVVGHSMGGRVGLEAAKLMSPAVIGVIGVDTLHNAEDIWDPDVANKLIADMDDDFVAVCGPFVRSMFGDRADQVLIDSIEADMCSGPGEIGAALLRDYIAYDLTAAFQATDVPVRCVNSSQWPTSVEVNSKYADFQVTIIDGHGHFLMQEAPDMLNQKLIEIVTSMSSQKTQPSEPLAIIRE